MYNVEKDEEHEGLTCCEADGDEDEDFEANEEQNYIVRQMMLSPKHDD